jgi:hypothetical protein
VKDPNFLSEDYVPFSFTDQKFEGNNYMKGKTLSQLVHQTAEVTTPLFWVLRVLVLVIYSFLHTHFTYTTLLIFLFTIHNAVISYVVNYVLWHSVSLLWKNQSISSLLGIKNPYIVSNTILSC